MKKLLKRFFFWPVPRSLPIKKFGGCNPDRDWTWDDWHASRKRAFPVKYFLLETLPDWFDIKCSRIERAIWYVRHHTDKRYHLLDLRQNKEWHSSWNYRYGWIDSDAQMEFACFNILRNFVESEKGGLEKIEQEIKEYPNENKDNTGKNYLIKVREIYLWWMEERFVKINAIDKAQDIWLESKTKTDLDKMCALEEEFAAELDKYLHALIDMRKYMWT